MSSYIKLSTLEYPRHEGNIRIEYPEISEDLTGETFPCPDTYALVQETPEPETTSTQVAEELTPVCIDGVWQRVWSIRQLTPEEVALRDAKIQAMIDEMSAPI